MDAITNMLSVASERFQKNVAGSFTSMTAKEWIRLVIIVGAYALLRPYLMKLGAHMQMKAHEKAEQEEIATGKDRAAISPNQLRGQIDILEDSDDDDEGGDSGQASAADWGKKARRRQRKFVKDMLDAHEKKLAESFDELEDNDIAEFLT